MLNYKGRRINLLLFNMVTDVDHPVQGFNTGWINELAKYCETIHVVTMLKGKIEVSDNVQVYSVGKELGYSEPRRALVFYHHLFNILRIVRIDACFVHMIPLFAVMGAPMLKAKSIPITLWYTHKSVTPLLRVAEKLVDRVVTASPESFRIPSSKVIVTGHGIDTDIFVPKVTLHSDMDSFTIVSVGRIAPIKNLEILINAVHILATGGKVGEIVVRLIGGVYPHDIDYAAELARQVREYGLSDIVKWVGPVSHDNVQEEYQGADVVVNLSSTGSLDKAPLEAMSCAVPVLTSNVAFYDLLSGIDPNLLLPEGQPHILADRLEMLSKMNRGDKIQLGETLRHMVKDNHSLMGLMHKLVFEILISNG